MLVLEGEDGICKTGRPIDDRQAVGQAGAMSHPRRRSLFVFRSGNNLHGNSSELVSAPHSSGAAFSPASSTLP